MSDSETPQRDPERPDLPGSSKIRKGAWATVALLCVALGTLASLLGAHSVARTDAEEARSAFGQSSAGIASTLRLAIRHEEDLTIAAGTFFAANPKASPREFAAWVKWTHPLGHYPELERLALVTLVPRQPGKGAPHASPTARSHCFAIAGLARGIAKYPPPGLDYCTQLPGLLSSRDSGRRVYALVPTGRTESLAVETPVYRGGVPRSSAASRRGAFVGWLHELLAPQVLLGAALRGHRDSAGRLGYRVGSSTARFTSATPRQGAQSATIALQHGWTATIFGAPANAGVLANDSARTLLITGTLLSLALGLLAFLLGSRTRRVPAMPAETLKLPPEQLYDGLTALPNRALTLDLAERMVARAARQTGMLAGALVIDIDWFKDVNEKLGQAAGDQLLKIVVQRLAGVVRGGDVVGRLGGDQFVVLVEAKARGARLDSLARRLIESLHDPVGLDTFGPSFVVTASIGVAFGRYATSEDLLRDAQLALEAAKSAGKARYTMFNANMRSVTEGHETLEVELNTALQEQQFFLVYQPIYNLNTRKVVGLEALIRWLHPSRGVLLPEDFIPLAEETGLMVPIGRWMLEQACARAAAWNVVGHRIGISVLVSANQLDRDGFATDVRRALQQSGIEPSLLTLDIAESTVMSDVAGSTARLQEIKQLGVRLGIDDFGSEYAHRSDLKQMPLDFLKVDRGSLAASEDEDYRSWLLEAILHFGRDISLTVIAKGVETHEQMAALQAMGCTMAQGFFMGEPTPAEGVAGVLAADLPMMPA